MFNLSELKKEAGIESLGIAGVFGGDVLDDSSPKTIFHAASLSKPVFAYLVLKLTEIATLSLDMNGFNEILPFKTFCDKHDFKWKNDEDITTENIDRINRMTPAMILSHKTGFDLSNFTNEVNYQFEPGQEYYRYSGLPLFYLQKVIEKMTDCTLETLAQEYVFKKLNMNNTSFGDSPCAANSLTTTAGDYARFIAAWMNDENLAFAFDSQISLFHDPWANDIGVSKEILNHLAWGLGWGLQIDGEGKVISAFHSGDMNDSRAFVAINLEEKTGVVFFAKSKNGLLLAEHLISPIVNVDTALEYISRKYGFAVRYESDWEANQKDRFTEIENYLKCRQSFDQSKSLMLSSQGNNTSHEVDLPNSSLLESHGLFGKIEKSHLIKNRHNNPDLQREYDKQFGLVLKK